MCSATTKLAIFMAVVVDPMRVLHEHSELLRLAKNMLEHLLLEMAYLVYSLSWATPSETRTPA
jgi:hypothetical protein